MNEPKLQHEQQPEPVVTTSIPSSANDNDTLRNRGNTRAASSANDNDVTVVSPLVNEKTYGERVYNGIFNWGSNYWLNLTSSALFSQWAENGTAPFKLPFMKNKITPREMQQNIANYAKDSDPLMTGRIPFTQTSIPHFKGYIAKAGEDAVKMLETSRDKAAERLLEVGMKLDELAPEKALSELTKHLVEDRAMARARSLTLLLPGFFVVIPTVWLGAKIKPAFVEWANRRHYGDAAMDDPTLKARQHAIEAEARPTFTGAFAARIATMFAAQLTAQAVGSKGNFVSKNVPGMEEFGVNEITEKAGTAIGNAFPKSMQKGVSAFTRKRAGLDWSEEQIRKGEHFLVDEKTGKIATDHITGEKTIRPYDRALQDLGRFIAADTFYTMVTFLTIHPAMKLLSKIPGMSYKPKMPKDTEHFDKNETIVVPAKIKVPSNQFGDLADRGDDNAAAPAPAVPQTDTPGLSLKEVSAHGTLEQREQQIA